jgi:hypothetical protein
MKAIYAYYSKPFGSVDIRKAKTHWITTHSEFFVLCYSVIKMKESGLETVLFCDEYGKKLIIDEFKIPFDIVKVELDGIEKKPRFWASGKIYAYTKGLNSLGGFEPFIMVDNDAGFRKKPPTHFLTSKYRCQSIHIDKNTVFEQYLKRIQKETKNEFPFDIFHECDSLDGLKGGNAGIVVINDERLWSEFTRYTWALMEHSFFDKIENENSNLNSSYAKLRLWNVIVEENLLLLLNRRLNFELPQTVFEFTGLFVPRKDNGTTVPNPTQYFHIWGSKKNAKFIKHYEELALNYIPKEISERIYNYFK